MHPEIGEVEGLCCRCRQDVHLEAPEVRRTAGGHWQAFGRCPRCGGRVSTFVGVGERAGPQTTVRIGLQTQLLLQRGARLTGSTQRSLVDALVGRHLGDLVRERLEGAAADGALDPAEHRRRLAALEGDVDRWATGNPGRDPVAAALRWLRRQLPSRDAGPRRGGEGE